MAKDAELDRLKATQDLAFSRKQTAYDAQDAAWKTRKAAGDKMHAAFEEKQRAYDAQQKSWEGLQRLRDSYGPRIERLNASQETAFKNMSASFDNASAAHDRRDGAAAKSYSEQGQAYKAESKAYVEERRGLVAELRSATDRHNTYTPVFQAAKERFNAAKSAYDSTKTTHERAQTEFKAAKAVFDSASKAFKARLDAVKAQNAKKANDKRSIAERAGVPYAYRDNVYTNKDSDGTIQIYFGGVGEPNGPGHGHYTMDSSGKVTYKREPFDPHGEQNFVRDPDLERRLGTTALNIFHRERSTFGPQTVQFYEGGVKVKVRSGFNHRTSTIATDFIIVDPARPGEHLHLVLSEHDGSILFSEWRKDHS